MSTPFWTLGELTVIAVAIPLAPFVAWLLSHAWDAFVGWFLDSPDLEDTRR